MAKSDCFTQNLSNTGNKLEVYWFWPDLTGLAVLGRIWLYLALYLVYLALLARQGPTSPYYPYPSPSLTTPLPTLTPPTLVPPHRHGHSGRHVSVLSAPASGSEQAVGLGPRKPNVSSSQTETGPGR